MVSSFARVFIEDAEYWPQQFYRAQITSWMTSPLLRSVGATTAGAQILGNVALSWAFNAVLDTFGGRALFPSPWALIERELQDELELRVDFAGGGVNRLQGKRALLRNAIRRQVTLVATLDMLVAFAAAPWTTMTVGDQFAQAFGLESPISNMLRRLPGMGDVWAAVFEKMDTSTAEGRALIYRLLAYIPKEALVQNLMAIRDVPGELAKLLLTPDQGDALATLFKLETHFPGYTYWGMAAQTWAIAGILMDWVVFPMLYFTVVDGAEDLVHWGLNYVEDKLGSGGKRRNLHHIPFSKNPLKFMGKHALMGIARRFQPMTAPLIRAVRVWTRKGPDITQATALDFVPPSLQRRAAQFYRIRDEERAFLNPRAITPRDGTFRFHDIIPEGEGNLAYIKAPLSKTGGEESEPSKPATPTQMMWSGIYHAERASSSPPPLLYGTTTARDYDVDAFTWAIAEGRPSTTTRAPDEDLRRAGRVQDYIDALGAVLLVDSTLATPELNSL